MNLAIPIIAKTRPVVEAVLNFLYPPFCSTCEVRLGAGERLVCSECWQSLPRLEPGWADRSHADVYEAVAVWEFNDKLQDIVHEFKFFGKRSLAIPLGDEMSALLRRRPTYLKVDMMVPIPLHKTKFRERGFNQSELLARRIERVLNIPCTTSVLRRKKYTKAQSKLDAEARRLNVADAFEVVKPDVVRAKRILLVDDVTTTGTTFRVCAQALLNAGAAKVRAVAAARTP